VPQPVCWLTNQPAANCSLQLDSTGVKATLEGGAAVVRAPRDASAAAKTESASIARLGEVVNVPLSRRSRRAAVGGVQQRPEPPRTGGNDIRRNKGPAAAGCPISPTTDPRWRARAPAGRRAPAAQASAPSFATASSDCPPPGRAVMRLIQRLAPTRNSRAKARRQRSRAPAPPYAGQPAVVAVVLRWKKVSTRGGAGSGSARHAGRRSPRRRPPRARHRPDEATTPVASRTSSGASSGDRRHRRPHAHRAQAVHADAAVAVGHRQPPGERDGGVLGQRNGASRSPSAAGRPTPSPGSSLPARASWAAPWRRGGARRVDAVGELQTSSGVVRSERWRRRVRAKSRWGPRRPAPAR
jgi:hypothetical protein